MEAFLSKMSLNAVGSDLVLLALTSRNKRGTFSRLILFIPTFSSLRNYQEQST